jgi:hypothetical protein
MVRVDRCFKGGKPAHGMVPVLFDHIIPGAGGNPRQTILRKGDYRLYFLKAEEDKYVLADEWFAQLKISRQLAPDSGKADPMDLLEMDLKAGLSDTDRDRMLDSIRMLGNMRRLQSKAELFALLDSGDALVRAYVYQALLRLQDYVALPATEEWLLSQQKDPPESLFLPRDALLYMEFQLASDISEIRDPQHLGTLERLLKMPSLKIRREMVNGIRAMNLMQSAPILLKLLDDPDADISFTAMQGLIELAGGGPIDWVPTYLKFRDNQKYYAATCREWWEAQRPHSRE